MCRFVFSYKGKKLKLSDMSLLGLLMGFSAPGFSDQFYLGSEFSRMDLEQSEFDSTNVIGVLVGYQFNNWAVEGSYNTSETSNEFYGGDQNISMYHLYSVYRTAGNIYYKAKLGVTNERYKFYDENGSLRLDDVHTGVARGLGVGYRVNSFNVELDYSWLGGSLETIGLGVRYNFN